MGTRKVPGTQMQGKESNGEKGGGDKEGHLGFGDVDAGHDGHSGGHDQEHHVFQAYVMRDLL